MLIRHVILVIMIVLTFICWEPVGLSTGTKVLLSWKKDKFNIELYYQPNDYNQQETAGVDLFLSGIYII